nr:hypothetical protein CFP56_78306 [Quercus suber]
MGRRHAQAQRSPWDLLRAAMGETNTVCFARECPSYTKLAWLTNHRQELQGTLGDTAAAVVIVAADDAFKPHLAPWSTLDWVPGACHEHAYPWPSSRGVAPGHRRMPPP